MIQGVIGIAIQGFAKRIGRLRKIAAALRGSQVVINLAERNRIGNGLKRLLRSGVIARLKQSQAQQEAGLAIMDVLGSNLLKPLDRLAIFLARVVDSAELVRRVPEVGVQAGSLQE